MHCTKFSCRSTELRVQRTVHPTTENEWPKRFAGLNGALRRRICQNCGLSIATIELTEDELNKIVQRGYIPNVTV